ncbi:MAG TPA: tRNA 2-thiouridine(34) synthase MnmA [Gaiellaceae bacterium]|nr:tRNA 2-thiouridine(34) synthase MnmA [Gaiellaceae bacterium]
MATVEVFGDATRNGEWAAVRLLVDGDRILEADALGLDGSLSGQTLIDAAKIGGEPLAVEALGAALGQVFVAEPDPGRVVVAMSSGVDSAVTVLRSAPNAIGVTLRLWQDPDGPSAERVCCSPDAVTAARATCHALGLPHVTLDLREEFRETVVAHFVASYEIGETPNPCTRCNGEFRFDAMLAFAARAGARRLHTGHYARVVERHGRAFVGRAADPDKDQSYMLASLDPAVLERVSFPLGDQTKEETRAEAARAGLAAATRPESQEACFLAGGDYRDFLERQGLASDEGPIVDADGRILGRHDGYWRFTPGQRRGLGVVAERPLHVVRTDPAANAVIVGPQEALGVRRVEAQGRLHVPVERVDAKLRHRSPAVRASVTEATDGFSLELDAPVQAIAKGQLAALYDGDAVVGAGVVTDVS